MKKLFYLGAILYSTSLFAQDIKLSGTLASASNKSLVLSNLLEQKWTISADSTGKFNQSLPNIEKGYYNFSTAGNIYLEPGYELSITKAKEGIVFRGKGSEENNLMMLC